MNLLAISLVAILLVGAHAQYEAGHVRILEDQRYQEGRRFGNYRNQEDGTKYHEETDELGVRRGSWQFIGVDGKINRVKFEAGPGIGFRILESNVVAPTPIAKKAGSQPVAFVPEPAAPAPRVQAAPAPRFHAAPAPRVHTAPVRTAAPVHIQPQAPIPAQPEPQNLFDYPGDLQFFRDHTGHRFKFTATA